MTIKRYSNSSRTLKRKPFLSLLFLILNIKTVFPWSPGTHENLASAMIENCNPQITSLFNQTGWDKDKVVCYAKWADMGFLSDFPYDEKETFRGWEAISEYNSFDAEYLSYARLGYKDFHDQLYVDLNGNPVPYPTSKQLNDPIWKTQHVLRHTIYDGEKLFGIFLHKVADCSVPVGHEPARGSCDLAVDALFELNASDLPVEGSNSKYFDFNPSIIFKVDDWNKYCGIFKSNIIDYAKEFCPNSVIYSATPSLIVPSCFSDAIKLGNVVIVKYLNAVLKRDLPPPPRQLIFNAGTVLNPQILFGTTYYEIQSSLYLDTDVKIVAYVSLRDYNFDYHTYDLYSGELKQMGFEGKIGPLTWPSYETMNNDGINKDLIGYFYVHASASGFIPWDKGLMVSFKGVITLANDGYMQTGGILQK